MRKRIEKDQKRDTDRKKKKMLVLCLALGTALLSGCGMKTDGGDIDKVSDITAEEGQSEENTPEGQDENTPEGQDADTPKGQDEDTPEGQDANAPEAQDENTPEGQDKDTSGGQDTKSDDGSTAGKADNTYRTFQEPNKGKPLAEALGIPESVSVDVSCEGSGINSIQIEDDSIHVPNGDKMTVTEYKKADINQEYKKQVIEALFDKDPGVFDVGYIDGNGLSASMLDGLFEEDEPVTEYDGNYFVGKIGGLVYYIIFTDAETAAEFNGEPGFILNLYEGELLNSKPLERASLYTV